MKPENRRHSTDPISFAQLKGWALEAQERKRDRLRANTPPEIPSDQHVYQGDKPSPLAGSTAGKNPPGRPKNRLGGKCIRGHVLTIRNTKVKGDSLRCLDCRKENGWN